MGIQTFFLEMIQQITLSVSQSTRYQRTVPVTRVNNCSETPQTYERERVEVALPTIEGESSTLANQARWQPPEDEFDQGQLHFLSPRAPESIRSLLIDPTPNNVLPLPVESENNRLGLPPPYSETGSSALPSLNLEPLANELPPAYSDPLRSSLLLPPSFLHQQPPAYQERPLHPPAYFPEVKENEFAFPSGKVHRIGSNKFFTCLMLKNCRELWVSSEKGKIWIRSFEGRAWLLTPIGRLAKREMLENRRMSLFQRDNLNH